MNSTVILYRVTTLLLLAMGLLVFIGPVLDYQDKDTVQLFGWINNASIGIALTFIMISPASLIKMRSFRERCFVLLVLALLFWMFWYTTIMTEQYFLSIGSLVGLAGAIGAGILSFVLARDGYGVHKAIAWMIGLSVIALPIAPALIMIAPDAQDNFWINVYGFSNVRVFGFFSASVIAILTGLAMHKSSSKRHILLLSIGLAIGWALLFWSGSRGGLMALVAGLLLIVPTMKGISLFGAFCASAAAAIGIFASMWLYLPDNNFGILDRLARNKTAIDIATQNAAEDVIAAEAIKAVSSSRIDLWNWTIGHISESPLLGYGYLPISWMKEEPFNFYHSHNLALEYALAFGIPAAVIVLGFGVWMWVRSIRVARRINTPVTNALILFVTVMAAYANVSAALFFPYHLLLFCMAMGTLLGIGVMTSGMTAPDISETATLGSFDDIPDVFK